MGASPFFFFLACGVGSLSLLESLATNDSSARVRFALSFFSFFSFFSSSGGWGKIKL